MDENMQKIDLNLADEEALTQLTGVGPRLAQRIIEARPFESVDDLIRVRGISEKDVERLRPQVTVGSGLGNGLDNGLADSAADDEQRMIAD